MVFRTGREGQDGVFGMSGEGLASGAGHTAIGRRLKRLAGEEGQAGTAAEHACVVLVHGLWMNAAALGLLQFRLRSDRFKVLRFGYPTVRTEAL